MKMDQFDCGQITQTGWIADLSSSSEPSCCFSPPLIWLPIILHVATWSAVAEWIKHVPKKARDSSPRSANHFGCRRQLDVIQLIATLGLTRSYVVSCSSKFSVSWLQSLLPYCVMDPSYYYHHRSVLNSETNHTNHGLFPRVMFPNEWICMENRKWSYVSGKR